MPQSKRTVFVSYAHPDRPREVVKELIDFLVTQDLLVRSDFDVTTAQGPPEGWPRWMRHQLQSADWILVLSGPAYKRRYEGHPTPGIGLGANWEGAIITNELYMSGSMNHRFLPLLDDTANVEVIPDDLRAYTRYRIPSERSTLARALRNGPSQGDAADRRTVSTRQSARVIAQANKRASQILAKSRGSKKGKEVGREELDTLILAARASARQSVVSLSGDLSWLERDLANLEALRRERPNLKAAIFYDKSEVPRQIASTFERVEGLGFELRPYPILLTDLKCLLIDRERSDARLCTFRRLDHRTVGKEKPQKFLWQEFGPSDRVQIETTKALVAALEQLQPDPILVAISGVNNVGKSRITKRLVQALSERFNVEFDEDVFRGHTREKKDEITLQDNYIMLWKQMLIENRKSRASVRILDRSLVDNFCFLQVRGADPNLCKQLEPSVVAHAHRYDLIVDVRRVDEDYSANTPFGEGETRAAFRRGLDQFFRDHVLEPLVLHTDGRRLDLSADEAATTIARTVNQIAIRRRMSSGQ